MNDLTTAVLGFERELRQAGLAIGVSESMDFIRAVTLLDVGVRSDVRSASRSVHVHRREDIPTHDEVFDRYWGLGTRLATMAVPRISPSRSGGGGEGEAEAPVELVVRRTYSPAEILRRRKFDRMTADELREAERLVEQLPLALPRRPTRRFELHAHGTRLAPRPMMRRSLAAGGELVDWLWRRPRVTARPVTLLVDVSGSMETYARLLLRFAHALLRVNRHTEVFVFGTRLTRVTRALATRRVDDALARVSAQVQDWSGGTRIGEALREYNRRWAARTGSSDGVVIVMSDGWDRGDPTLVASETARLRRNSRRLLWLNPLAGAAGFEPLAAGMAAAVRHVDRLLPAGSLHDLESFARLLADSNWGAKALPHSIQSGPNRVDGVVPDR